MTDGVLELALVGAGRMGRMHLRALDPAGGRTAAVRVTDVVEPTQAARDALRDNGYRFHVVVELALVGAGRMGRMHLRALDPAEGGRRRSA